MPTSGPTVKSLDERVDDLERTIHPEIADLKVKIAVEHSELSTRMGEMVTELKVNVAKFQGSMETSLNLAK